MGGWYDRSIHASWAAYAWLVSRLSPIRPSAPFAARGFITGVIPKEQVDACVAMVRRAPTTVMQADDAAPGFRRSEKVYKVAKTLNAGHRYFLPSPADREPLRAVLQALAPALRDAMGSEFRVVNTRILETLPAAEPMGPNAWHGDGFPPAMLKVMVYLTPPGPQTGTTEFKTDSGAALPIEGPAGTWVLFRNSVVIHRGVPPAATARLAMELTLVPAFVRDVEPFFAGLNATYPEYPWSLHPLTRLRRPRRAPVGGETATAGKADRAALKAERAAAKVAAAAEKEARAAAALRHRRREQRRIAFVNRLMPPVAVNIGGGAEFAHHRWLNLEGAPGPANPVPFRFHPDCRFPLRDGAVGTVYSSHCFEHLDDATVARVLAEAYRVLRHDGRLVIKIPDFDRALAAWRAGDATFFDADRWGLRRLIPLWARRGLDDSLDARAAMVFCGFWNDEYGDHFSERRDDPRAYHGPPPLNAVEFERVSQLGTPHAVAAALRAHVTTQEPSFHFNHQNAWGVDEFQALLAAAGFEVIAHDAEAVIAGAGDVPGIATARTESAYYLARPRR